MEEEKVIVYPYRWVVLSVFSFLNITIQILWISFASITQPAALFYHVSDLQIGMLAMVFMIVFIPLSLPVSWMIDTLGFRKSVNIGALIMAVFAILRGIFAMNFTLVMIFTICVAISQPFFLNAWTKIAALWFPIQERATAVGLVSVATFLGTGLGLVLTPIFIESWGIAGTQLAYGILAAFSSLLFLILARETPPTPPGPIDQQGRALMLDGLKSLVKSKPFWVLMVLFLIGNGIFNGLSTWIESIVRPRGFTPAQAGVLGGLLLLGGILGAFILSTLSDKTRKRKLFLLIGMLGGIPALLGLTYAQSYGLLILSTFSFGFFMISTAPIGYQYAAELTYPVPEGTSNGMLTLIGQISVVFIYGMEALKNADGSFTNSLLILAGLVFINALVVTRLEEPKLLTEAAAR